MYYKMWARLSNERCKMQSWTRSQTVQIIYFFCSELHHWLTTKARVGSRDGGEVCTAKELQAWQLHLLSHANPEAAVRTTCIRSSHPPSPWAALSWVFRSQLLEWKRIFLCILTRQVLGLNLISPVMFGRKPQFPQTGIYNSDHCSCIS